MKKLSKAQERELERIQKNYANDLERGIKEFTDDIKNYGKSRPDGFHIPLSFYQEHLDMYKKGYVVWYSANSRTLEILAEHGFIEYIKNDNYNRSYTLDWVKLL